MYRSLDRSGCFCLTGRLHDEYAQHQEHCQRSFLGGQAGGSWNSEKMANEFDGDQRATLWVDNLMLGQDTGPCKILSTLVRTNIFDLPRKLHHWLGSPTML